MKIAFVLPVPNWKFIGGYKVVYEYANYIATHGNDVTIFYNARKGKNSKRIPSFLVYVLRYFMGKFGPSWFTLNKNIHKIVCYSYDQERFDGFDIVIATATETAPDVAKSSSKKIYFVQDFENWGGRTVEEVNATFKLDFQLIAISKWLKEKIKDSSQKEVEYIPDGVDKMIFFEKKSFMDRKPHTLSFLYHDDPRKGCDIALRIIKRLKEKYNDFEVYAFGYPKRVSDWPQWIHYKQKATPEEVSAVMNQSKVFLCTSRQEGFGLTGLESLFCGCILVTTDCLGIREYATNENSFICDVDDEENLFLSICQAYEQDSICQNKRKQAKKILETFDAEACKRKFLNYVIKYYKASI